MAFDYKKEYKEFYMPGTKPEIVTVPKMNYLAVRGSGDPNIEGGEYKESISLLYGVAYTIQKKKQDFSKVEFLTLEEGLCVQCMHIGAYEDEPRTVAMMDGYLQASGYENDFTAERLHHEIYLSDPRRVPPERRKTVIRHPIRKAF